MRRLKLHAVEMARGWKCERLKVWTVESVNGWKCERLKVWTVEFAAVEIAAVEMA